MRNSKDEKNKLQRKSMVSISKDKNEMVIMGFETCFVLLWNRIRIKTGFDTKLYLRINGTYFICVLTSFPLSYCVYQYNRTKKLSNKSDKTHLQQRYL